MACIDTVMGFEYDRSHSDAVYEPTPDVEQNTSPFSSQGRGKSETPFVLLEMK